MAESDLPLLTIVLLTAACLLSLVVLVQVGTTYTSAYLSAPSEITTFIDAVDFSIQENESYDKDVSRVQKLEDKLRLGKLLREIQRCGDDLREDLNGLLVDEGGAKMKTPARISWGHTRKRLEERVRRLDMLRMRFLVLYMGISIGTHEKPDKMERSLEKMNIPKAPGQPPLFKMEGHVRRPPMRRLTTQAIGHNDHSSGPHRMGWAGVVQELQKSPLMARRHASIESALAKEG
jgi:hypothetical protein